jgi:uracil-DNA glycosylase family 4
MELITMTTFNPQEWAVGHLRKLQEKGLDTEELMGMAQSLADTALAHHYTRRLVSTCDWCPSFKGCGTKAMGYGSFNSPVMIVSDRSTEDDAQWGQAMVGTDGFLLTLLLNKLGVDRQTVYVTNLIKCFKADHIPGNDEANQCLVHLAKEIDVIKPAVIITLGQFAAKIILDDEKFRLHTDEDGGAFRDYAGIKVRPAYSLQYLLSLEGDRHIAAKRAVWKDFKAAFDMADTLRPGYNYRMSEYGPTPVPA